MLKYKILIKLYVLRCVLICCVYGDTILKYKKYVHVCGCLCVQYMTVPLPSTTWSLGMAL
jgi:hypothetical protein